MQGLVENFSFLNLWVLALAPLPWILKRIIKPAEKQEIPLISAEIFSRVQELNQQQNLIQPNNWKNVQTLGFTLIWILLLLAAMRPVWFLTPTPFTSSGKDLILSVDLSGSMQKPDMKVNGRPVDRLIALKSVVDEFIEQRKGDRMGLIVFGSNAYLVSPLTYDLSAIRSLLRETAIGMAGNNTAIGDSIGLALKHLKEQRHNKAVLILLTDGSNNAGALDPLDAAKKAQEMGLTIHTIAFGAVTQNQLEEMSNKGEIDLPTLKEIADLTGGQMFVANQTSKLKEIYASINQLEASEYTLNQYRIRSELYIYPLALALLFSSLMAINYLVRK